MGYQVFSLSCVLLLSKLKKITKYQEHKRLKARATIGWILMALLLAVVVLLIIVILLWKVRYFLLSYTKLCARTLQSDLCVKKQLAEWNEAQALFLWDVTKGKEGNLVGKKENTFCPSFGMGYSRLTN